MTSIPRDLLVDIPGVGNQVKINAAYENFGERGAVRAVKKLLTIDGKPFPINHVITVDFARLPARDRLHRLRLRRHRPRLLQRPGRARRLRGDRHRPRLPEAVRQGRARLRALPPRRQRSRARRPPAGLPAPGAQREGHAQAAGRRHRARQPEEAGAGVRALLRPRQDAWTPRSEVFKFAKTVLFTVEQPGARGALPRSPTRPTGEPDRLRVDARRDGLRVHEREGLGDAARADRADQGRDRGVAASGRSARRTSRPRSRGSRRRAPRARTRRSSARARSTSRSTSRRCAPAPRPTRAPSRGPTRSATSAAAQARRLPARASPRASSASTTGSRA